MAQAAPGAPPNANPDRLRAIVQSEARKAGTKAVEFGMWTHDREILTMALGESMTTVPATTEMHYRIGGIAATKSETATTDASAFDILREVVKYVTPATPINF